MAEVQVKLRYNPDEEVVELVVGDEVVGDSGKEEFASWVGAYNEVHPPVAPEPTEEEKLRQQVADLEAALEVANAANAPEEEPETGTEPEVDPEPQT